MEFFILFCVTPINVSEYGDINLYSNHQEVSTCETFEESNNCNHTGGKGNVYISNLPHFKTIVTSKPNGRLGNHILSYMHLLRIEFNFNVTILTEKIVKKSLDTFFKNFNKIKTVDDDACGYFEFFDQLNQAEDKFIIDLFREKSGIDVTMKRGPEGIKVSPNEVAMKYGEEINTEMHFYQKQFLQNFRADSASLPSGCKYKVIHNGEDYQMKRIIKLGLLLKCHY